MKEGKDKGNECEGKQDEGRMRQEDKREQRKEKGGKGIGEER